MKAVLHNVRISPRKIRIIVMIVKKYPLEKAMSALSKMPQKGAKILYKLLKSAHANSGYQKDLKISSLRVGEGLKMKRYQPIARGSVHPILKRTSHVYVELSN